MSRPRARGAARRLTSRGLLALLLSPAVLSCVSERATGARADVEGCDVRLPPEAFGSTIVVIRAFAFRPPETRVRPGTKVTWVNCDPAGSESHTSTADAGAWSSPLLPPGATFTREFASAGEFPYHCTPHPGMMARVLVE